MFVRRLGFRVSGVLSWRELTTPRCRATTQTWRKVPHFQSDQVNKSRKLIHFSPMKLQRALKVMAHESPYLQPRFRGLRKPVWGFTLVELMITVVIVAILAGVALPSFLEQIRKSRRSDAVAALAALQQAQERFRSSNTAYASALSSVGLSATSADGYYTIEITSGTASATGYTATAVPVAGRSQTSDTGCNNSTAATRMTVTVTNGVPSYSPAACWSR